MPSLHRGSRRDRHRHRRYPAAHRRHVTSLRQERSPRCSPVVGPRRNHHASCTTPYPNTAAGPWRDRRHRCDRAVPVLCGRTADHRYTDTPVTGAEIVLRPDFVTGRALNLEWFVDVENPRIVAVFLVDLATAGGTTQFGIYMDPPRNLLPRHQAPQRIVTALDEGLGGGDGSVGDFACPWVAPDIDPRLFDFFCTE